MSESPEWLREIASRPDTGIKTPFGNRWARAEALMAEGVPEDEARRRAAYIGYEACWKFHPQKGRCRAPIGHEGDCAFVWSESDGIGGPEA